MSPSQLSVFRANALILVVVSALYQSLALLGLIDITAGGLEKLAFGLGEMVLILALLANAWAIKRSLLRTQPDSLATRSARLMFWSLAVCAVGDLVNRNFTGATFSHGPVIEHAYLADSAWAFLPGYGLYLLASILVARAFGISVRHIGVTAAVAGLIGLVAYLDMARADAGAYILATTGSYAVFITVVGASTIWLTRALGWARAWPVAVGAVLALLADALIGHFWIFRDGHFPAISHVNWILYFGSQALLQQLPLQLARNSHWATRASSEK